MADVFPYLANVEGIQRGPDIVEWTRIFVIPEMRGPDSKVLHTVLAGILEYCLQKEISAITVVMETWWLPRLRELGWQVKALGLPTMIETMNCIGAMISVTEDAWLNTLASKGINSPVLKRREPSRLSSVAGSSLPKQQEEAFRYALAMLSEMLIMFPNRPELLKVVETSDLSDEL